MTIINNELYYSNSEQNRIRDAVQLHNEAAKKVQDPSKYKTVDELEASGNKPELDGLIHKQTIAHAYIETAKSAQSTLDDECSALRKLREMIDDFRSDSALAAFGNSAIQPAQDFLTKLEGLLNSSNSQGRFTFGGKNQDIAPCGDLNLVSNLDAQGNPTSNYTTASSDNKTIRISDIQTIKTGIDASNPIFVYAIGAANAYKNGNKGSADSYLKTATDLMYNALSVKEGALATIETTIDDHETEIANINIYIEQEFKTDQSINAIKFGETENNLKRQIELLIKMKEINQLFTKF